MDLWVQGLRLLGPRFRDQGLRIWEFPKIGDPKQVPYIVGSLL